MGVDPSGGDKFRRTFRLLDCTEPRLCRLAMESMADEIDALRAEVERAASVLSRIAEELGPMVDGDPCPVCHTYSHKGWCWHPALVEWDKQQAERSATRKESPCKP